MSIISISVDDDLLLKIGSLQKEFGFSGRSDLFRVALTKLSIELKQEQKDIKETDAILILVHSKETQVVAKIVHKYSSLIKTQMHSHTNDKKCEELFLLFGDSKKIYQMQQDFIKNRKIDLVKLIFL